MCYVNYSGKYLKCLTDKFSNFTKDKLYPVISRFSTTDGRPVDFEITDDDGDYIYIKFLLRKQNKFTIQKRR